MIRSELDVLLERVEDAALREDLRTQIDRLKQRRSFGLVFEQHIPERVRLPQHPIRIGSQVVSRDDADSPTYEVLAIEDGLATLELTRDHDGAYVARGEHPVGERQRLPIDSLVVITDFGEPVLPGFRTLGTVERDGDKPYHVVINGENHHALEALRFTHAGKVDCIYIDPPYNTGAHDWKYNNDYVDETDAYRHSKWLAFMERRLNLAKELLNPDDSVLIVTIDEKEYLRLGLLLEQTFAGYPIQMVTTVTNPSGSSRLALFSRSDEYILIVLVGRAKVIPTGDDMLNAASESPRFDVRWDSLRRRGNASRRSRIPSLYFPIYFESSSGVFHSCGEMVPEGVSAPPPIPGLDCVLPVTAGGSQMTWSLSPDGFESRLAKGYVRYYRKPSGEHVIRFLQEGTIRAIKKGQASPNGVDEHGFPRWTFRSARRMTPMTTWHRSSHSATDFGTPIVGALLPGRHFPYPKSLYAVEDTLRFFVADKPNALVVDFFAGSGTTAHAVMRLNRQDGGRRQSIMVTNNEVSVEDAKGLRAKGLRPGDPDWEALGIFEHITRPRVTAAITGRTPDGEPIKGDYKFTDEFPMAEGFEENAAFLELRYLDADDVDLGLAWDDVAPLLWLRAGATGPIAPRTDAGKPVPYTWTDRYGILFDEDKWRAFVSDCPETATAAFIVTNAPIAFAGIAAELPTGMDTVRLPDSYLSIFLPERGRA